MGLVRHFQRGGGGVFQCRICKRGTRDTGVQSLGSKLCPECYELAGLENAMYDGCLTEADYPEVRSLYETCLKRGGSREQLNRQFADLFERAQPAADPMDSISDIETERQKKGGK